MASHGGSPLLEDWLYKHTIVGDYVVKRYVQLYPNCFTTRRKDPVTEPEGEYSIYELCHTARLIPADAGAIERKKRHIRPHGVGSMTALAAIRGKGQSVELYTFKLDQSHAWDFRFCFQDKVQAEKWHAQLTKVIDDLRVAAGIPPRMSQMGRPTFPSGNGASDSGMESHAGSLYEEANATVSPSSRRTLTQETFQHSPLQVVSSHVTEDEDAELSRLMNFPAGPARSRQTRWVPYRHSNGLAIYQHQGQGISNKDNEYMVSAVVRGSPTDVLRALLDPTSSTTILGPALESEILESTPGRQVLRIQLQALGPTAAWFRPREAVVQRLLKKDEDGVYVVLFSSIDAADANTQEFGVIEIPEGLGEGVRRTHPIRCRVSGGYTISKRQGYRATDSPESLLTCILQVQDMGGWLNPGHPLFRVVDWWSGGAYEAFLERMLLGVMLVRDVVEKSRFVVAPQAFAFYEEEQQYVEATEEPAAAAAPFIADESGKAPPSLRTSTFVMREAATHFSQQAAQAAAAAARAPAGRAVQPSRTPFESPGSVLGSSGSYSVHLARGSLPKPLGVSRLASQRLPGSGALPPRALAPASVQEEEPEPAFKLPSKYYEEIHTPGRDYAFKVRGARYLTDGVKVQAREPMFELLGMEVVDTGSSKTCPHISRFLPCIRRSSKPFLFVFNLMVPGPPTMCCVIVFGSDTHPDELGPPPDDPEDSDWQPFDFLMWRFINGDDSERCSLFKMIPRVAEGSWLIRQSVGTTPVILAKKLATEFFVTEKYVEVAVDVGSSSTAQYVTGMVRGGARNLVLDLGLVLEGHNSWELPEVLLGAVRVRKLDLGAASKLDDTKEVPMRLIKSAAQTASAESKA